MLTSDPLTAHRAGVLGSPIGHSLSPVLHRAGYAALGLTDWSYAAHEVTEGELAGFVDGLDDRWRGLSLTMPLKEEALVLADRVSDVARAAGAANTLVRTDRGWVADNTDVVGLVGALQDVEHGGAATVLGSGATARSAVLALAQLGVRSVRLAVRAAPRPETVAVAEAAGIAVDVVLLDQWATVDGLFVSTLPGGAGRTAAAALGSGRGSGTLLDVVYADWPTPLARAATAYGLEVISGLEMLLHQGAEQFWLFTGQQAPLQAMRAAGLAALGRSAGS